MRAAKGIFRTVDEPFGQVDARPSKSYRISWIGVCSRAAPRTTPLIFLFPLSELDPKQLDVKSWISFHWEMGELLRIRVKATFPQLLMGVYENAISNSVPQGRLNLAQDASPGLGLKGRPSPARDG